MVIKLMFLVAALALGIAFVTSSLAANPVVPRLKARSRLSMVTFTWILMLAFLCLGLLPGRHRLAHAWRSLFFAFVAIGAWRISRRHRSDERNPIHILAGIMQIMTLLVIGWSAT
jgi:NhaP-type Na+/H+ or K+/H+ antiporter